MIVVGVDPGPADTGITSIRRDISGGVLIDHVTITHPRTPGRDLLQVSADYLEEVIDTVTAEVKITGAALVAVEGVVRPNWHVTDKTGGGRAAANPEAIIATGIVVGAVIANRRRFGVPLVVIRPGKNGKKHEMDRYPAALQPAGGKGKGYDKLRHVRSAYDVAQAGPLAHRIAQALGGVYPA